MDKDHILHLATLARLELSDTEIKSFPDQFKDIVAFIDQIKEVDVSQTAARDFSLINVMREDTNPHPTGEHRDAILDEMPATEKNYLRVKKILDN